MDAFNDPAVYVNPDGERKDINVIFEREVTQADGFQVAVPNAKVGAVCISSDVADADETAKLEFEDVVYKVKRAVPDGHGMTALYLSVD